jgi:hypothetical protein
MANAIKTLPQITVGTTAVPLSTSTSSKWASVSIQADSANSGKVYVGDSLVSTTRYSRVLNASDWFTISGSAIDPSKVYVLGSAAAQIVHPSGS